MEQATNLKLEDYRKIRRFAVQFSYSSDVNQQFTLQNSALENFIQHAEVLPEQRLFLRSMLSSLFDHLREIDSIIEKHAINWKISRIAKVDLAILRVATLELLERKDTDVGVILSEAAAIAQEFGSENSAGFVNGILDAVARDVRKKIENT